MSTRCWLGVSMVELSVTGAPGYNDKRLGTSALMLYEAEW
jgi:hypothetical protein